MKIVLLLMLALQIFTSPASFGHVLQNNFEKRFGLTCYYYPIIAKASSFIVNRASVSLGKTLNRIGLNEYKAYRDGLRQCIKIKSKAKIPKIPNIINRAVKQINSSRTTIDEAFKKAVERLAQEYTIPMNSDELVQSLNIKVTRAYTWCEIKQLRDQNKDDVLLTVDLYGQPYLDGDFVYTEHECINGSWIPFQRIEISSHKFEGTESHQKNKNADAQAPGKPTSNDGYGPPKNWDGKKVKHPKTGQYGYPDKNRNIWVPTGPGSLAHGGPHWDVVSKDGKKHRNILPGGHERGKK